VAAKPKQHGTLYRYFSADGELLYIGRTKRGQRRVLEHIQSAPWFDQVANATFEKVPLAELDRREAEAIYREQPRHNKISRGPLLRSSFFDALAVGRDQLRSDGLREGCVLVSHPSRKDRAFVFEIKADAKPGEVPHGIEIDTSDKAKFREFLRRTDAYGPDGNPLTC